MGMFNMFKNAGTSVITEFACPYKLGMRRVDFVNYATSILYAKILKRCYNKSRGLKEEQARNLWDSVEMSNAQYGVITLVANAMTNKSKLILVNDGGVVREADFKEAQEIEKDYKENGQSSKGVYMNFNKYTLTNLIKLYMEYIFDILQAGRVNLGVASAMQVKIADLRKTVGYDASNDVITQASDLSNGLKSGNSVMMDAGDNIVTTDLQTAPVVDALKMIYGQLASAIGVSTAFVCGELTSGMAVTGEADVNANEDGIKDFFVSVFKPIIDKLFNIDLKFKTDNWRKIKEYVQVIPYIESSMFITDKQKQEFFNFIFEDN